MPVAPLELVEEAARRLVTLGKWLRLQLAELAAKVLNKSGGVLEAAGVLLAAGEDDLAAGMVEDGYPQLAAFILARQVGQVRRR